MGRTTIDFGIDLGTTNSEMACMDNGELVIVKNLVTSSEVTPSAVKLDAKSSVIVGQNAYNELEFDPENAVGEFKRWMGNPAHDGFIFKKAQVRMKASELSAEVLKVLKGSASSRFGGEEINAAVITVPAMFLIPACEDTKVAANLAGIRISPLLQEPVAAAIAYGYKAENLSGNLLVFDLGGGTFDTTILTARDGRLIVLGHDGDDKLGGKDYDWAIVDVLVQRLTQEYGDLGFKRDGSARRAMAKLKYLAEDAKKSLSLLDQVAIEVKRLEGRFEDVDTVIQLSRCDFEKATEQLTDRCIRVCRRLLEQSRISKDDIASVLVVGGQTKSPCVRELVISEFGRADFRLDPMTVVASGAALFASTQRMPSTSARTGPSVKAAIRFAYNPVSGDLDADVSMSIEPASSGLSVTIIRADGGWSSGAIPVPPSGKISATVALRARKANSFNVQIRDSSGTHLVTGESHFTITHGLPEVHATTSKAFRVALENNESHIIVPKGSPLPAKGQQQLVTSHEVVAGNPKSTLKIYVLEGDDSRADRNYGIGLIELNGNDLRRSLPAGEVVDVTYRIDDSKTLSAEAIFPSIREARQMVYLPERPSLTVDEIELEIRKEKDRLEEVERAAPEKVGSQIGQHIVLIEKEKVAAADDPDARQKAAQQLIELKQAIDILQRSSEWELLVADLESYRGPTQRIAEANGTENQRRDLDQIVRTADAAVKGRDITDLRSAVERLRDIYWEIALAQDDFWKAQFARMWEEPEFIDPLKAERLKEEGLRATKRADIESLRTIVWELYRLLPTWQQGKLDMRFADAGLRRARGQSQ
ncbi:MAG TPA: Hsp70 family protein [Candidatus Angelobacter sp.]|nr:Hsp70 family protein [Candidatus Angelobacter sp.]